MQVLIAYATREGHTQIVAEHLRERLLSIGATAVELYDVADNGPEPSLTDCDGIILAASIHLGKHEKEMVAFVRRHRAELEAGKTAFLSVSMAEASAENAEVSAQQREQAATEVRDSVERFFAQCDWSTEEVLPVAGALMYTKYNILVRWVMKRIAAAHGGSTDTSENHVYTDWYSLDRFASEFLWEHFQS